VAPDCGDHRSGRSGRRRASPIAALSAGEQRYRRLFENLPICIFVADLTVTPAVILEANRRAELVYGYPAAELVGNPAAQLDPSLAGGAGLFGLRQMRERVLDLGGTLDIHSAIGHGTELLIHQFKRRDFYAQRDGIVRPCTSGGGCGLSGIATVRSIYSFS
jgi:PAS domain-containing protein